MNEYYKILEVSRDATLDEIKTAYRRLALKYHPDRNKGSKEAEKKFKEISNAYSVLSDEKRRKAYDLNGTEGVRQTGFSGWTDTDDILRNFSDLFSGFGMHVHEEYAPGAGTIDGKDIESRVRVNFRTAALGGKITIQLNGKLACSNCKGTGSMSGKLKPCVICKGSGRSTNIASEFDKLFSITKPCASCGGSGNTPNDPCRVCHSTGHVNKMRNIDVVIPEGARQGQLLRLNGLGGQSIRNGKAGDLYLNIEVDPDKEFRREGNDIISDLLLPFWTAALGGTVSGATLRGEVLVTVPPGTSSGAWLRLSRQGIKGGDHRFKVVISIPSNLSNRQKELLQQIEKEAL